MLLENKNHSLAWTEIDLDALRSNLRVIRKKLTQSRAEVLAVVKANAYGHGMKEVAKALANEGVSFFGVAAIDEALELRRICPSQRILVLGSFHKNQVPYFLGENITPTISSLEDYKLFENAAKRAGKFFPVHVKIDTGMGRLGVQAREAVEFFKKISNQAPILIEGVYTHFSRADHSDKKFTERQLILFEKIRNAALSMGFSPRFFHAANSLGTLRFKNSHLNLVRPGITLYGIRPSENGLHSLPLKPVLCWKTRVCFLKNVPKGTPISYGATYRTPKAARIATLPIGYSHGYRVGFSNKAQVIIQGKNCPVVGRVTMDQTLVEVGPLSPVRRWDEVILIGRQGSSHVSAEDLARLSGTIPYEILCSIHSRIPRIYKGIRY